MSRRMHFVLDLVIILFYCAVIFTASSFSLEEPPVYPFAGSDKLAHILLYCGLGLLLCRFLARDLRRSASAAMIVAATLTTLYGLSDEIHQVYVPGRNPSVLDFAANAVGAVLAVALWYFLMRPRRRPALLLMAQSQAQKVEDDAPV